MKSGCYAFGWVPHTKAGGKHEGMSKHNFRNQTRSCTRGEDQRKKRNTYKKKKVSGGGHLTWVEGVL